MTIEWTSTSVTPDSPYTNSRSLMMYLEAMIERVWRCTGKPWSSEFGDALGGRDRVNSEMHLEAMREQVWRCTWRPRLSELRDAFGGRDRVNSEMHSELWSSEFRDSLAAGYDRGRFEEYLEVVHLEAVDGRSAMCWDSIHRLVDSKPWKCDKVTLRLKLLWRTGWWQSICREVRPKLKLHLGVNSKSREWRDDRQS